MEGTNGSVSDLVGRPFGPDWNAPGGISRWDLQVRSPGGISRWDLQVRGTRGVKGIAPIPRSLISSSTSSWNLGVCMSVCVCVCVVGWGGRDKKIRKGRVYGQGPVFRWGKWDDEVAWAQRIHPDPLPPAYHPRPRLPQRIHPSIAVSHSDATLACIPLSLSLAQRRWWSGVG